MSSYVGDEGVALEDLFYRLRAGEIRTLVHLKRSQQLFESEETLDYDMKAVDWEGLKLDPGTNSAKGRRDIPTKMFASEEVEVWDIRVCQDDISRLWPQLPELHVHDPELLSGYIPPHINLMLAAVRDFKITSASSAPLKKILVDHFLKQVLPNGSKISRHQAESMATFCRPIEMMKGGLAKG